MERVFVGIDLGTSAVKVIAVTAAGERRAFSSEAYGFQTPAPLHVEQDVETLYAATVRVAQRIVAQVGGEGGEIAAIGFSSAMHGVVCTDDVGRPLSNAITWMDRRSAAIAAGWRADGTADALYPRTGAPMHPMLPVAKLRWLGEHDPTLVARTRRFVGLKELVVYRWTGEWLVDWGIAAATGMFAFATRAWDADALQLARIDDRRLATPAPPSTALPLRAEMRATLGVPATTVVVLGSSDGALATIGSGAGPADAVVTLGTSGAVRVLAAVPALDEQGRTFCYCADDRRFVIGGPTSSAGAALAWLFALVLAEVPVAERFARALEFAGRSRPGAAGVTVLPFLTGERAPYWDPSLRGSIAGLELAHDRADVVRAAFEGVVFGVFAVYEVVRERLGRSQRLLLSGGLTKGALVRELLADVFGTATVRPHEEETAALGAALLAAASTGAGDAVEAARAHGYDEPLPPRLEHAAAYAAAFERYRDLVGAERAVQPRERVAFRA